MITYGKFKAGTTDSEVSAFNAKWPCSELDSRRQYWFEFDSNGDLVDSDVPEHSDGQAALTMSDDVKAYIFESELAEWMQ